MLKDGQIICDACHAVITRVTTPSSDGWPQLHNLCSACYADLKKRSIPR